MFNYQRDPEGIFGQILPAPESQRLEGHELAARTTLQVLLWGAAPRGPAVERDAYDGGRHSLFRWSIAIDMKLVIWSFICELFLNHTMFLHKTRQQTKSPSTTNPSILLQHLVHHRAACWKNLKDVIWPYSTRNHTTWTAKRKHRTRTWVEHFKYVQILQIQKAHHLAQWRRHADIPKSRRKQFGATLDVATALLGTPTLPESLRLLSLLPA